MPNPRYAKGKNFERHVAAIYERMGWFSQMSAGSHGVDVVAIEPIQEEYLTCYECPEDQGIHFVHCRNWKRSGWMPPAEREAVIAQAHKYGAIPMLAYKDRGWTICKEIV